MLEVTLRRTDRYEKLRNILIHNIVGETFAAYGKLYVEFFHKIRILLLDKYKTNR